MFKKFLVVLAVLTMAFSFSACGSSHNTPPVKTLVGTWSADGGNGSQMVATVSNKDIVINLVDKNEKYLYWKGTFSEPSSISDGTTVISKADSAALYASFIGSEAKTTTFTYKDGSLTFEFNAMDVDRSVSMHKES